MRKITSIILGVVLLAAAVFFAKYLIDSKTKPKPKFDKVVKTVFVEPVKNHDVPIIITTSGNVTAKNKIELYSEVQGVLEPATKDFKAGTTYNKGTSILKINSDEFYANLQSQKSNFYNSITSIMPDIRLDYPNEYNKWQTYLQQFDINKPTPKLPELHSEQEKYFISGRGINTAYYNVKNLEVKLSKYSIRAPYSGVLTEALVTPGSLVRAGQKLGEFIDTDIYEMEVAVNAEFADLLKLDNEVTLHNLDKSKSFVGKVVRINGRVDAASQTINAYIELKDENLREGMYLEANLLARSEHDAIEVSRKLLVDNKQVYVVRDSVLDLIDVEPVYFSIDKAVIKGIEDETLLLAKPTPGAYQGMKVKQYEGKK
ncbi:MAG: efflux transporter periplasmic adaptor subunit [Bacteroidetes bacterium MedPE-SWsnd-G2]|nr:MAG: efflux transporter periplasmic adaptor subunit [Bacteroidetes bacterium MedPE-SWsnd-G2]